MEIDCIVPVINVKINKKRPKQNLDKKHKTSPSSEIPNLLEIRCVLTTNQNLSKLSKSFKSKRVTENSSKMSNKTDISEGYGSGASSPGSNSKFVFRNTKKCCSSGNEP